MRQCSEVMTKEVITVRPESPVLEAARLLVTHKISGLPVTDADNALIGIITEKDLLKLLIQSRSKETAVAAFMTKDVVSFQETDDIVTVCEFFMTHNVRRVPIVRGGKLRGVISRRDVISEIIRIREDMENFGLQA